MNEEQSRSSYALALKWGGGRRLSVEELADLDRLWPSLEPLPDGTDIFAEKLGPPTGLNVPLSKQEVF